MKNVNHKQTRTFGLNRSEMECMALIEARGKARVLRAGWPDFLLQRKDDGKLFGVEVKSGTDCIRQTQAVCFEALEAGGIPVFVWHPRKPDDFIPWRQFDAKHARRAARERVYEQRRRDNEQRRLENERYRKAFDEHRRLTGYDRASLEELVAGGGGGE